MAAGVSFDDPLKRLTNVSWDVDKKIYGLLAIKQSWFGSNFPGFVENLAFASLIGVTPKVVRTVAAGSGSTFLTTIGGFAGTQGAVESDPAGYHSYYLGSTFYGDNGPWSPLDSHFVSAEANPAGSLFVGTTMRDFSTFNAVWENGLAFRLPVGPSFLPDFAVTPTTPANDSLIGLAENFVATTPASGSLKFDVRSYVVVNIGKILKDQKAGGAIASFELELVGANLHSSVGSPPVPIEVDDQEFSWRVYKDGGTFKGATGRTIVNTDGTLLSEFSEDLTFSITDYPDLPGGVIHTFHYDTGLV